MIGDRFWEGGGVTKQMSIYIEIFEGENFFEEKKKRTKVKLVIHLRLEFHIGVEIEEAKDFRILNQDGVVLDFDDEKLMGLFREPLFCFHDMTVLSNFGSE